MHNYEEKRQEMLRIANLFVERFPKEEFVIQEIPIVVGSYGPLPMGFCLLSRKLYNALGSAGLIGPAEVQVKINSFVNGYTVSILPKYPKVFDGERYVGLAEAMIHDAFIIKKFPSFDEALLYLDTLTHINTNEFEMFFLDYKENFILCLEKAKAIRREVAAKTLNAGKEKK